jgi:hypothetical protein
MDSDRAPGDDGVGSLTEEAAKLLRALQGWAEDNGGSYADAAASAAAGAAGAAHRLDEHLATGSAACTVCPLCRVIAAVRGTTPEVREHFGAAAASLVQAVAGLMATTVPDPPERRGGASENLDRTDEGEVDPWR